ncbi:MULTISPECIES: ribonuclease YeeF family protein [Bacillus]|uniref:LXG domain-containing protein n=2 Tax=Bacillus TaxID=1386 RepID=A0AAJ3YYD0_9BACI|nr:MULTISPECIES: T7SS effector LXG polymorphic toxin [Bacillus]MDU0069789.1 LXG domain-containing protein [Bacillus sp. IG6]QAT65361.1 hypothetical protein EQZ20_10800 [Bacillus glycinifermentans]WKB79355.1 LXG domain-containing protein [Bacillus glycinifermentans]SCA85949.1 transposase [Bacillus glycinifermentans]
MKTLDVHALHHAIDQTLEQLKDQSKEIANLKKSVDGITSLDDALKGKGGDAIRAFYEECHTPFLRFYETFIEEYQSALKKIKNALDSFEPKHDGFISQAFLEHELEQGLNAADRTTKHLVSKANAAISKVSHIVDLPDLNDNDFHGQNRRALKDINQTIEKLHTFDREQTNALKTAENDLGTMQRYITRLEKMYTGPKIEITSYQKGSILKPDKMDTLSGNQETAMGVMLDKLDKRSKLEKEISEVSEHDIKISKLKKKLDDYDFSTASEFYEIAKEIGYENLSPWQQRYFNGIEGSRNFGNAIKGSGEGFKNAVVDTATGIWDMIVHADETIEGINYTIHHPIKVFNIMKQGIEESYERDVVNGDSYTQARWFSYAAGMVATSIVGSKGVDKVGKVAKAGKVGQVAAKATKTSKKVTSKTIKASKEAVEKSVASVKESIQRVASKVKGIQIHNPFAPQVQLVGGGKVPYHAIDGENFKKMLIRRIEKVFGDEKGVKNSRKIDYDLAKDYIRDVEAKTGLKIHKKQTEQLKSALRNHKFEKMTPKETMKHRNKFNNVKDKLISEWEEKTGQKWPRYKEQVFDKKGRVARDIGQPYDAHHIIENNFGGPHEWWNIHPAKFPDEHQAGIHGKGAPSNKLFPRR